MKFRKIEAFIPSGKHYEKSKDLFKAFGFELAWESDGYAGFQKDTTSFILQDYENEELANNLMIRIEVEDLDKFWDELQQKELDKTFDVRLREPTTFPYGREVHFIDLAGVCWHFAGDKL